MHARNLVNKVGIKGAAHTVIPIQRQHTHKIATSVDQLTTFILCTRDRYRRKIHLTSESAKEEETRLSRRQGRGRARRAAVFADDEKLSRL